MSRDIRKTYTGYQRYILAEIMTDKELNLLDNMYTNAKIQRTVKMAQDQKLPETKLNLNTIAKRQL